MQMNKSVIFILSLPLFVFKVSYQLGQEKFKIKAKVCVCVCVCVCVSIASDSSVKSNLAQCLPQRHEITSCVNCIDIDHSIINDQLF